MRLWFRKRPGSREAVGLTGFSRSVDLLYRQIAGKPPGLGNQLGRKGYMTPFEELWLASLRLLITDATLDQAREIYRKATCHRKPDTEIPGLCIGQVNPQLFTVRGATISDACVMSAFGKPTNPATGVRAPIPIRC